jgi:flavin reductase (DIM6/NTAB) family NADH-FMN oxidoreductase RutF
MSASMQSAVQHNEPVSFPLSLAADEPQPHELVDAGTFRQGMRFLASGVSIIASIHDGVRSGLTATAVCSVTADPPRLLVCVNKNVHAHNVIQASGILSVNLLSSQQEDIAKCFAGMQEGVSGTDRFSVGEWTQLITGAPILKHALVSFDCRVLESHTASSHTGLLCEVVGVRCGTDEDALVYFNGVFHALKSQ